MLSYVKVYGYTCRVSDPYFHFASLFNHVNVGQLIKEDISIPFPFRVNTLEGLYWSEKKTGSHKSSIHLQKKVISMDGWIFTILCPLYGIWVLYYIRLMGGWKWKAVYNGILFAVGNNGASGFEPGTSRSVGHLATRTTNSAGWQLINWATGTPIKSGCVPIYFNGRSVKFWKFTLTYLWISCNFNKYIIIILMLNMAMTVKALLRSNNFEIYFLANCWVFKLKAPLITRSGCGIPPSLVPDLLNGS